MVLKNMEVFQPPKTKRTFEDVAEQIKNVIMSGTLKAGDRLPSERVLAEQFQVGRVSIREAFRMLETTGFVSIKKGSHGGAFVSSGGFEGMVSTILDKLFLSGTTHEMMIEARISIGCAVIGSAVEHATDEDLERIYVCVENAKKVLDPSSLEKIILRMLDFHLLIADASHNIPYTVFMQLMMEWARRKLKQWMPSANGEEQVFFYKSATKMLDALRARDKIVAMRLMEQHILKFGEFLAPLDSESQIG